MKTNIIVFLTGRSLALRVEKRNRVAAIIAGHLERIFDRYLHDIIETKLYAAYLKDAREGEFDLQHMVWCFKESLPHDINMYRLCFVSLASKTGDDDWSQIDYQRVLSIVLSVNPHVLGGSTLLKKCVNELAIQISKGRGGVDRLYKI